MKSVMFTYGEDATEESQDQIRNQILGLPGVRNVGRISPNATKPALRRMWYAEVMDDAAAADLVGQLRGHKEI